MNSTDPITTPEIRKLRPNDESDEFVKLMELVFDDSVEENRLNVDELRKILKKLCTPTYRVLMRVMGMKLEFYVAEIENNIASGILMSIEKNEVYVSDLMTHPNFRRQGLARKLLQLSFRRARELDVKKVNIDVRADSVNAVNLFSSEGFETTFHSGRFELDSAIESISNDLIIREINKIPTSDIDPMLDDCFPASYLDAFGREKFLKELIPSRAIRFLAKRLGGQLIRNYAFYVKGNETPRGIMQVSQSRVEKRISLSSLILFEKDNDLLLEFLPRVLEIETDYSGITTATINFSMDRTDAIAKIESLGFKKMRENISMTKRL
ncbi:MAG: GNAT family N-acetyltransferase [Candidatus Thorarchaeota archaeon]